MVGGLFVRCAGRGPRVVLLHGGVLAGELCWRQQLRLADRFALEIVDRAGYGRSQQVSPGEDQRDGRRPSDRTANTRFRKAGSEVPARLANMPLSSTMRSDVRTSARTAPASWARHSSTSSAAFSSSRSEPAIEMASGRSRLAAEALAGVLCALHASMRWTESGGSGTLA
jgi:hypothetical protein